MSVKLKLRCSCAVDVLRNQTYYLGSMSMLVFFQLMQKYGLWGCQCFAAIFFAPKNTTFHQLRSQERLAPPPGRSLLLPCVRNAIGMGWWGISWSLMPLFFGQGRVCDTNERFFTGFQKPQVSPACLEKFHLLLFGLNCKGPVLKQIVGWIQNSNHLCWLWQKTFVNTSLFAAWVFDANGPLGGIREKYDLSQWKLYPNIPCPRRRLLCCFGSFELWKDPIVVLVAWYRGLPWISFSRGFNITPKGFFVCDCSFNLFAFLHCFPIFSIRCLSECNHGDI